MTTDKPAPVALNLDTLDVEGSSEPFAFVVKGQRFTMADPTGLDWQVVAGLGADLRSDLQHLLGDEQYARFSELRGVTGRHVRRLVEAVQAHYGLGEPGEDVASSGS